MSKDNMNQEKKSNKPESGKSPQKKGMVPNPQVNKNKNFLFILFLVLGGLFLASLYQDDNITEINHTRFQKIMKDPESLVQSLKLRRTADGVQVTGVILQTESKMDKADQKEESVLSPLRKKKSNSIEFKTHLLVLDQETIDMWERTKHVKIEILHDTAGWLGHLFNFLPVILLIGFFWFMMSRQSGGGGGGRGVFSFGKSKAKMQDGSKPLVGFKDVAGCDEAKEDLNEIVDFLKDSKKYSSLGARIPKGALLTGPPGTGKTLLAKAVAGEAGVPFFSMSGSDFVEMFVGVGASRVRDLFETAKKNKPCIVFIDEIDAVGRQRGAGVGGGNDEREQTLNQLLVEMDGFEANEGVVLIAATNRADVLDKALLRPGRFDRQIVVDAPTAKGRKAILEVHIRKNKVPISDDVNLETVAKGTPGLAGADIENLVNEAALLAARYNAKKVSMVDFEEAKDKIMIGTERRSMIMTDEEKRTTAYHEAGHGLITHLMKHSDTLHKLTIIPRGGALGITFSLPDKEHFTRSKDFFLDQIAILLAGRAAEILMFNQKNTGASNDIERATSIARRMVCEWGMTDELGPLMYGEKQSQPFLGRDMGSKTEYSAKTAVLIDDVVRGIIDTEMKRTDDLLTKNKELLISLAEALIEHEVLDREEILKVIDGENLESTKKTRQYKAMNLAKLERQIKEERKEKETTDEAVESTESEDDDDVNKGNDLDTKA
jgi:cell division protease FtsH